MLTTSHNQLTNVTLLSLTVFEVRITARSLDLFFCTPVEIFLPNMDPTKNLNTTQEGVPVYHAVVVCTSLFTVATTNKQIKKETKSKDLQCSWKKLSGKKLCWVCVECSNYVGFIVFAVSEGRSPSSLQICACCVVQLCVEVFLEIQGCPKARLTETFEKSSV